MVTRRRLLSRAVTLALGGFVGAGAVAAEPSAADSTNGATTVTARGTPTVIGLTGLPDAVAPRVAATTRRYRTLSLSDVEYASTTARTTGPQLHTGVGTAYGAFDAAAIARELDAKTAFTRVTDSDGDDPQTVATLDRRTRQPKQPDSGAELLVRSRSPAVIWLDDRRIDVTRGLAVEEATDRLATARQRSATAVPDDQGRVAALLDGDVVAHARLGDSARQRIRTELPDSAATLDSVVAGTRAAGVGATVGPEQTTLRYALRLGDRRSREAAESLIEQFADDTGTELLDRYSIRDGVVADISVETSALWSAHERLVDS